MVQGGFMKIDIEDVGEDKEKSKTKNKKDANAAIVSFNTCGKKFDSNYERNKFFRGLHGWKQIIRKNKKKYTYKREGLLDEIPHIKVASSAFIVALNHLEEILDYLEEWEPKVQFKTFKIKINKRGAFDDE